MIAFPPRDPPSLEELAELYRRLKTRVEGLEGNVRQLLAERTRDALPHPTWRDLESLRKDIARLEQMLSARRRPRRVADDHRTA